ncbi:MAG: peptide chain release factor H, partial [Hyphomicrobiales bacterium]
MTERWIMLSAGRGPRECQWVVQRLIPVLCKEAGAQDLSAALSDTGEGDDGLPKSALLAVEGQGADAFAAGLEGTIQWVGASPFRPNHKRKNWFVGVFALAPPEEHEELSPEDVRFEAMRAAGPGGQHVNTTDSAVRARHVPSGLTVVARQERSQHANKRQALIKLAGLLRDAAEAQSAGETKDRWRRHDAVE